MTDADLVFAGNTLTIVDERRDYGEERFITVGKLRGRMVVFVWTPRKSSRQIICMRKANDRERKLYEERLA